jgi:hypothetical protein
MIWVCRFAASQNEEANQDLGFSICAVPAKQIILMTRKYVAL